MACATKEAAVLRTYGLMVAGGQVQVLDADGFLQETRTVPGPGDRPWWYLPIWRFAWVLGVVLVLQGVLGVVDAAIDTHWGLLFWLRLIQGLMGLVCLPLCLGSRRHDRRLTQQDGGEPGTQPDAAERVEPNGPERRT